eukprot:1139821-Pelagomonas_calceolata.AAC.2
MEKTSRSLVDHSVAQNKHVMASNKTSKLICEQKAKFAETLFNHILGHFKSAGTARTISQR